MLPTVIKDLGQVNAYVKNRQKRFESEGFLRAFLNPPSRGCAEHDDPECLCDVDISKTANMTWNRAPKDFLGVVTRDELLLTAANIWLNLDVASEKDNTQYYSWLDDPDKVSQVVEAIEAGKSLRTIREECGIFFQDHMLSLARRALNVERRNFVDLDRLRALHAEGLSLAEMARRLETIDGHKYQTGTLSKALKRMGLQPNRPKGRGGRPPRVRKDESA